MNALTPGFHGKPRRLTDRLPPGQYPTEMFPVLSAGPTPRLRTETYTFTLTSETGERHTWDWDGLLALPQEEVTTDLHCVTRWSKFDTRWKGVALDTLLEAAGGAGPRARYIVAESHGGYTTNIPLAEVTGGRAWIVHEYDGFPVSPEHGGPLRLLVPRLYFWKSAKWLQGIRLTVEDEPGFWENAGYHSHGDPWREERTWSD
ncbi:molybdopterin-dependent oxidoreductase [Streptomyces sp. NRRL F-5630]|uniref:molybdopterin-dependent oxidoreductase n=1 Tax=Streptomyces sp. NRRL F-5630 TaxID=1463864 RepID=UPI003D72F209